MSSIKLRYTGIFAVLFAGCILILILAGTFLIEPWFAWRSRGSFESVLAVLLPPRDSAAAWGPDVSGLTRTVKELAAGTVFKISVADREGMVIVSSAPEFQPGHRFPLPRDEREFLKARLSRLDRGDKFYGILTPDPPGQAVLYLIAALGDELYVIANQPLAPLRNAISMASSFFILFGILVLILALGGVLALSARETQPVLELSELALKIAGGSLGERWSGRRDDEIGVLGRSINSMADRLSRMIGELEHKVKAQEAFMAGASHELKTPVGLVRGYAEALELGYWSTDAERDELIGTIVKEADRLDRLVGELSFVAMDGGAGYSLLATDADLAATARKAAGRFMRDAEARGIALRADGGNILQARCDEHRLVQALDNLLSNALRHTPTGGTVAVSVRKRGGLACIEVENTGERIPEAALPHLFDPFYRVDASRNRASGGSGLGLALVRRVAEAHGGLCGIENTDTGVRAWIGIPALHGNNLPPGGAAPGSRASPER